MIRRAIVVSLVCSLPAAASTKMSCTEVLSTQVVPEKRQKGEETGYRVAQQSGTQMMSVLIGEGSVELFTSDHIKSGAVEPDHLVVSSKEEGRLIATRQFGAAIDVFAVNTATGGALWSRLRASDGSGSPVQITTAFKCVKVVG